MQYEAPQFFGNLSEHQMLRRRITSAFNAGVFAGVFRGNPRDLRHEAAVVIYPVPANVEFAGFATYYRPRADTLWLHTVWVEAAHRRHGVGRALIEAVRGLRGDSEEVEFGVFSGNAPMLALLASVDARAVATTFRLGHAK